MLRKLFNDETGAVVSAELILILTITFCAAAVGWSTISSAVVTELNDVSEMIGSVDQSYSYGAHRAPASTGSHGSCSPSGFNDITDDCDCKALVRLSTCGKTQSAGTTDTVTGGTDGN